MKAQPSARHCERRGSISPAWSRPRAIRSTRRFKATTNSGVPPDGNRRAARSPLRSNDQLESRPENAERCLRIAAQINRDVLLAGHRVWIRNGRDTLCFAEKVLVHIGPLAKQNHAPA